MIQAAVIKCKAEMEVFCLEKLAFLLSRETEEIGKLIFKLASFYRQNMEDFNKVILA